MNLHPAFGAIALLAALMLAACDEKPAYQALAYRIGDPAHTRSEPLSKSPLGNGSGNQSQLSPSAVVIDGETRSVLSNHREYPLFSLAGSEIPEPSGGFIRASFLLPGPLGAQPGVYVRVRVKPAGKQASWSEVPAEITKIEPGGMLYLKFAVAGGKPAHLEIFARSLSESRQILAGPHRVPKGAVLDFGFGIEPVGWRPGTPAVTFRVLATTKGGKGKRKLLFENRLDPAAEVSDRRWVDARVDLGGLSGEEVVFVFESAIDSDRPAATYPLWSNPGVYATEPRPESALNFILISLDTLRARNLSTHGYAFSTSPFLNALAAREAIVFENAFTTAPTTRPSHMSMFTSLLPTVHDLTTGLLPLSSKLVTLPEILRRAGYDTQAVTENGWVAGYWGFARGMNSYRENLSPDLFKSTGQMDLMVDRALEWLQGNSSRKFFLFLHTYQVHSPYQPPAAYNDLFVPYAYDGVTYQDEEDLPAHLRAMRNYDREIRYTDDELRRLFEGIHDLGLDETTVVLITSDHGEEFLEHGYLQHATHLYEEILRVPLIVWGPSVVREPRRIAAQVSILDIMPTILDLGGLPVPGTLQGTSLARSIRGDNASPGTPHRTVFAEAWGLHAMGPDGRWISWDRPAFAIRNARFKYIMKNIHDPKGPQFELYDLEADPREQDNLAATKPDPWPAGREKLLGYHKANLEKRRALLSAGNAQAPQKPITIDPEREEKLRALGYIQ